MTAINIHPLSNRYWTWTQFHRQVQTYSEWVTRLTNVYNTLPNKIIGTPPNQITLLNFVFNVFNVLWSWTINHEWNHKHIFFFISSSSSSSLIIITTKTTVATRQLHFFSNNIFLDQTKHIILGEYLLWNWKVYSVNLKKNTESCVLNKKYIYILSKTADIGRCQLKVSDRRPKSSSSSS